LNAEEPSLIGSIIRVHGCFLRHHSLIAGHLVVLKSERRTAVVEPGFHLREAIFDRVIES
jgi:hypothetical protein